MSSPTQYFWYRETLDISPDINTSETFNLQIAGSLTAAWLVKTMQITQALNTYLTIGSYNLCCRTLVWLCLAKGLASSPKVLKDLCNFTFTLFGIFAVGLCHCTLSILRTHPVLLSRSDAGGDERRHSASLHPKGNTTAIALNSLNHRLLFILLTLTCLLSSPVGKAGRSCRMVGRSSFVSYHSSFNII